MNGLHLRLISLYLFGEKQSWSTHKSWRGRRMSQQTAFDKLYQNRNNKCHKHATYLILLRKYLSLQVSTCRPTHLTTAPAPAQATCHSYCTPGAWKAEEPVRNKQSGVDLILNPHPERTDRRTEGQTGREYIYCIMRCDVFPCICAFCCLPFLEATSGADFEKLGMQAKLNI